MSIVEEVFVGREEEIEQFFEFLKKKDCPAFVVIGEPGIGKSSFLKEICRRSESQFKGKVFVGFHEVPFNPSMANPFVGVLEELMKNVPEDFKKRVRRVFEKIIVEKASAMAKMIVRAAAIKILGEEGFKEFEKYYREFLRTPSIFSFADDIVSKYKTEFIYDYISFFKELVAEFKDVDFVLVIDQFERAQMSSCGDLLNFVSWKPDRVHVLFSFKVEKEGAKKFAWMKPNLVQSNALILELPRLSVEDVRQWMLRCGKDFSYPELRKIRELSDGFPFTISEWLKTSKECDLRVLEAVRGRYCEFVKWRIDGVRDECKLMLRRLCVLLQPLSIENYEKLTGIDTERCGLFLNELVDKWIFDKYGDTLWFRHELIRFCVEQGLTESEERRYHEAAARFFQQKFDEATKANEKVDFDVGLGCAYHCHFAGKYKESLEHNAQFARFCFDAGSLDVAEGCYLRVMEDAEALGDEDSKMAAKGNLASVYYVWGRTDEAFQTYGEVLEYYKNKGDKPNEAVALHQLARIEQDRGNYEKARELYRQSLDIKRRLGDLSGISKILHQLAMIYQDRGEYDEAIRLYEQSLATFQKLGDQRSIALSYGQLGLLHESLNKPTIAADYYLKALNFFQKIGDKPHAAKAKTDYERVTKQKKQ